MMKKVTLCTVFSFLVFSGFVAGPWGLDLVGAGTTVAATCKDLPNVEACILIYKDGKVKLKAGNGKTLKKPKKGTDPVGNGEPAGDKKSTLELPVILQDDVLGDADKKYTEHNITIYGDKTCMWFGSWYCW